MTSLPRPEAAVVWGKVITEIEQRTLLPLRATYFDEDGARARVMAFSEPKTFGTRTLPTVLLLTVVDKPGERTIVTYEAFQFDVAMAPGLFTLRGLRRR